MESTTRNSTVDGFRVVVHDDRDSVAGMRAAVDDLAAEHGLAPETAFDLKVAVTEAVANALRHPGAPRAAHVTVAAGDDAVEVEVRNQGRFRVGTGPDVERGRGLPLMVALADEVQFSATEDGTCVRIRMRTASDQGPA
ncbi:MAG: ATP-binding protein [Thermoleophilia bacterium]|nr:ATP-binding protein [Thermoleophilia bacterium]